MVLYASVANHLYQLTHFGLAFLLLMVVWPRYLFPKADGDREDQWVAGLLRVALLYIALGYALVLLKLFEWMAVVCILLLISFRHYFRKTGGAARVKLKTAIALLFYELLDVGFRMRHQVAHWWKEKRANWRQGLRTRRVDWRKALPLGLLLAVMGASAYLRLYDAFTSAAPALSDGYVTLAWLKYINQRVLFHDGIYPQGFHITLALLHKFAAIDQLYILKYTGPLVGLLISLGLYYATYRLTGNRYAGVVAAALYGLGGYAFHGSDWTRQAATNSQEYSMVFAFPAFWFYARYLRDGRRSDLWTATAGCSVSGLVHSLVFGYVGMGLGVLIVVGLVLHPKLYGKRVWHLCLSGLAAVVIALIPLGIGELIGRSVHGSSGEFLTSTAEIHPPALEFWDLVTLAAVGLSLLYALVVRKRWRDRVMEGFVVGIGAATFFLYEFAGTLLQNVMLDARTHSLWTLAMPVLIGAGLHALWSLLHRWGTVKAVAESLTVLALLAMLVVQTRLEPILPYKMEWESGVEQYVRISETFRPKTWMIVSQNEGYALVLGNGYHLYLGQLLEMYDPILPPLTRRGWTLTDPNIPHDIFIYQEKNVFEVSRENVIYAELEAEYQKRKKENIEFQTWIDTYEAKHGDVEIYYEDENLRIYHIIQPIGFEEEQKRIWGGS